MCVWYSISIAITQHSIIHPSVPRVCCSVEMTYMFAFVHAPCGSLSLFLICVRLCHCVRARMYLRTYVWMCVCVHVYVYGNIQPMDGVFDGWKHSLCCFVCNGALVASQQTMLTIHNMSKWFHVNIKTSVVKIKIRLTARGTKIQHCWNMYIQTHVNMYIVGAEFPLVKLSP